MTDNPFDALTQPAEHAEWDRLDREADAEADRRFDVFTSLLRREVMQQAAPAGGATGSTAGDLVAAKRARLAAETDPAGRLTPAQRAEWDESSRRARERTTAGAGDTHQPKPTTWNDRTAAVDELLASGHYFSDEGLHDRNGVLVETPRGASSWDPIDLGPYLRGEVQRAEPTIGVVRNDGIRLLYPGKEHSVIGEMESGKSWLLLACAVAEMASGNPVVYVHFEECDPSGTVERLVALGARDEDIIKLFKFVGPEQRGDHMRVAALLDPPPTLVILDGVNEAMSLHGWAIREEDGAASFRRHLVKPFTRAGAAVCVADHVVKDRERRDRGPIGSIHKGNAVDGALILLENTEPFGRQQHGRSSVFVTKDRPGYLRSHGEPTKLPGKTFMGSLVVDDTRKFNPWLELSFLAPKQHTDAVAVDASDAEQFREVDDKVFAAVEKLSGEAQKLTITRIRAVAGYANTKTRDALTRLVLAGRLAEKSSERDSTLFTILTRSQDQADSSSP